MKYVFQIFKEAMLLIKANLRTTLITTIIGSVVALVLISHCPISYVLIILPMFFGIVVSSLAFVRENKEVEIANIFAPLKAGNYWKILSLYGWMYLFTLLWSLLWVVPGVIKALGYSLAPYILADNPDIAPKEAMNKSAKMMNGYKGHLFLMWLMLIAVVYASLWCRGIPLLVIIPFAVIVMAKFYNHVKAAAEAAN